MQELNHKEGWALKNWCFWTVVLGKTLESPLDCKEIKPVNLKEINLEYSLEGLMLKLKLQYFGHLMWRTDAWILGKTDTEAEMPILWPPDVKNWLLRKDPDAGRDWGQEEKGMTEDETFGWHQWLSGHVFEQALGDGDGQGILACCSSRGHKEPDTT